MSASIHFSSATRLEPEELDAVKSPFRTGALVAVITMLVISALAITGVALTASGYLAAGLPLIVLSIPLGYFSYNAYRACSNTLEMLDNYMEYVTQEGFDKQKVKNKICQKTICFDYAVDYLISKLA